MVQLQRDISRLQAADIQVVGVSYDPVKVLKSFADKRSVTFPLLADEQSTVIDAYGVRNRSARPNTRSAGIPHPVTILIDRKGVIRAKLPGTVTRRHSSDQLLKAARDARLPAKGE